MQQSIEAMLDAFEQGNIGRRDLIAGLGGLVLALAGSGSALAAGAGGSSTFRATSVSHIALNVTDVARSRDFYLKHLGLAVIRESQRNCFLSCGDDFVALFKSNEPGMDHYCYSIEDYDAAAAVETLERGGLEPTRRENRVYFPDPDGVTVQVERGGFAPRPE